MAGTAERPLDIINLYNLEAEAEKLIPRAPFGYISSGSGDEWALKENTRAFNDRQILPRYLAGVEIPSTETEILGARIGTPIFVPPMASHGLAHASADPGPGLHVQGGEQRGRTVPLVVERLDLAFRPRTAPGRARAG